MRAYQEDREHCDRPARFAYRHTTLSYKDQDRHADCKV